MEFLATIDVNIPRDVPAEELEQLRITERARGLELWRSGVLKRIWKIPGRWAVRALYEAESTTALQEMFESFPMYAFMTIDVEPLAEHPLEKEERAL